MSNEFKPRAKRPVQPTTPGRLALWAIATLAAFCTATNVHAQTVERTGKQVVESTCVACHGLGTNGAPRIGDAAAWGKRASGGLTALGEAALKGIRQMPAHGGNPGLTDNEIKRGVAYMVNQSGGKWVEPADKETKVVERAGEQIVKARCADCHLAGLKGAPKVGDRDAWAPRLKNGLDPLMRSAINGHGGMPARGGMANLTDAEMRAAINYMFNPGAVAPK